VDTMQAIRGRRSVRHYTEQPLDDRTVDRLIDAAIWAPSGGNAQTWRFCVVRNPDSIGGLRMVAPGLPGPPPCVLVICQDMTAAWECGRTLASQRLAFLDAAMAAQNVLLAAHDMGLGSCAVASFHAGAVCKLLGIPEGVEPILLVALGWPDEKPDPPPRRREEVVFYERFDNA
jgi:nitroreductase